MYATELEPAGIAEPATAVPMWFDPDPKMAYMYSITDGYPMALAMETKSAAVSSQSPTPSTSVSTGYLGYSSTSLEAGSDSYVVAWTKLRASHVF